MSFSSFYNIPLVEAKFRDLPESVYTEAERICDLYLKAKKDKKQDKITRDWKEYFAEIKETVKYLKPIGQARFFDLKTKKDRRFSIYIAYEVNVNDYAMCDYEGSVIVLYDDNCKGLPREKLVSTIYHEIVHGLQQHKTYSKKYEKMKQDPSLKDSDELWAQYHKEPIEFDAYTSEIALHIRKHLNKLKDDINKSLFPETKKVMENKLKKFILELKLFVRSPLDNYTILEELPLPVPFRTFVGFLKDIYRSPKHWKKFKIKLTELLKTLDSSLLKESPDNLIYQGKSLNFHDKEGNPQTFFITQVSIRKDYEQGYRSDVESPLGLCIVYCSSKTSAAPSKMVRRYYEDMETIELTHTNLASLLIYNKKYSYKHLKKLGINFYSFKTNIDKFFDSLSSKATATLTKESEAIGLKYRGRFWIVDGKAIVSMWHFDEKVCMKYLIPFFKNKFNIKEEDIVFEVSSFKENENTPQGTGKYVSGSALTGKTVIQKPYEKEINKLLAKLHVASGSDKERVREELKQLLLKHNIDPANYGISDEVLKGSQLTAQKLLDKSEQPMASLKARMQTSESLLDK